MEYFIYLALGIVTFALLAGLNLALLSDEGE